ncbi:hypothetical protein EDB89DRAFT_2235544 [Lactarius sanguifluus]|nr:hypothetical protein EDB89DRAFT_2235544 [Lactarius sanguifluus]
MNCATVDSNAVHTTVDNDPIFASTPPSSSVSPTLPPSASFPTPSHYSSLAHSAAEENPEILSTFSSPVIAPALFFMPTSDEYLPSATQHQPESEPASASESPVSKFGLSPRTLLLPPDQTLAPLLSSPTLLSLPLLEISMLDLLPVALSPDQSFKSSLSVSLPRPCEFESTPVSAVDVASLSSESPEFSESKSSQGEPIPFLLASPEAPSNAPTSAHSTLLQRPPGLKTVDSVSSPLISHQHSSYQPLDSDAKPS